ncbi:hypothetical protein [Caldibacillus thermoamylovorans]|uniref:hypothetical protein n=1 Tax=Caldibacillus thermoamylovorans TaxID=35841 RepID=UPI00203EB853|nr:hypothetical protein [Caldibacillus thermoamylovorans]MCM3053631.1 hypothetical protein [Caldibacillus thermoamylovorans]
MLYFGDETRFRHHFGLEKAQFWRRDPFSSPFWGEKLHFLTTRPVFVTILGWKKLNFGDEPRSRHHFGVRNSIF